MKYILRPYQQEAVRAGVAVLSGEPRNEVIVLPTGAGKSLVIANIADALDGQCLVLQPSKEILEQNYLKLKNLGRNDVSIYSASLGIKRISRITLATIGSIHRKPELFDELEYILVDECDLVNAKGGMYKEFFDTNGKPVLGFTASPWRLQPGKQVGVIHARGGRTIPKYSGSVNQIITRTRAKVFQSFAHITQISELYDQGYLCPLDYIEGYFDPQLKLTLNSSGNDYTDATYKRISSNVVRDAVKAVQETPAKSHLIFMQRIEDAENVSVDLYEKGVHCAIVSGDTPKNEREALIKAWMNLEIPAIANVGVLTVGVDHPQLDHIVLGRPVNSARLYYQMIGRGLRIHPDKKSCTITDLCGNVDRLGKIENWEITDKGEGFRLYNDGKPLTGIDLKTGEDVEKKHDAFSKSQNEIHFGKHKGKQFSEVPMDYLRWIRDSFSPGDFRNKAIDEISRRIS